MPRSIRASVSQLLGSPILWGVACFLLFEAVLTLDFPGRAFLLRYTAGHPIEYAETFLFFLGLAVLIRRGLEVLAERGRLDRVWLPQDARAPRELLAGLERLPQTIKADAVSRGLRGGLVHLCRGGSPEQLPDRVEIALDEVAEERREGYGFVRFVVWAIPILGFLGTVVGITLSLGNLSPQQLEETLPHVMAGLMVAFDTTALALSLSMVLMLVQYLVDRTEQGVLAAARGTVEDQLLARFPADSRPASELHAVKRMAEAVLQSCQELVTQQVQLWRESLQEAQRHWQGAWTTWQTSLGETLGGALQHSLGQHVSLMQAAEEKHLERIKTTCQELSREIMTRGDSLLRAMAAQQEQLSTLAATIHDHVTVWNEINGEVDRLNQIEHLLQQNLSAVTSAKHFEEALASLAAAANLLSANLHHVSAESLPRTERPRRAEAA